MSPKSEVFTWRLSADLKASLEEAARSGHRSVASLLDEIVTDRLRDVGRGDQDDSERQRRLHRRAARLAGRISGSDPSRAERATALLRARLLSRRTRRRRP